MTSQDQKARRVPEGSYDFGSNWRSFLDGYLTEERQSQARDSLTDFMRVESLQGKSFLDIGCGSGLFSMAAHDLGASSIHSLDVNRNSVDCCRTLHERAGSPDHWRVEYGSVLDDDYMSGLPQFDVVYSWGVLHHTGEMWHAIRNAAKRVAPGGQLYIAIYNKADGFGVYSDGRAGSSKFWVWEKQLYVALPTPGKRVLDWLSAAALILVYLLRLQNPVRQIREHKSLRGMSWMVDIRDWLGGYPYEYASVAEIFRFVNDEFGYELENVASTNSLMNNEFLFRRREPSG